MINIDRVLIGGLYLVNLDGNVNPEFGFEHYCVILKTHDKELYLALPTTSKIKKDKFVFQIPEDNSFCLFKHSRTISERRIIKPLVKNGKQIIISTENLIDLTDEYQKYIKEIVKRSIQINRINFQNKMVDF